MTTSLLVVERVVWTPGDEWREALGHLADRFERVAPLDVNSVLDAGDLSAQLAMLDDWVTEADVDLDRELGRWLDEHLAMHLRPDPGVTRTVRARAADGPVHAASSLGPRAAESLLRHAGCWRSITQLHADLRDDAAFDALAAELDAQPLLVDA